MRRTLASAKTLHLTFDDGPDEAATPQILDVLAEHSTKATFFVVAERAKSKREIIAKVLSEGHAIGNHSLDHSYGAFFKGLPAMKNWIQQAESDSTALTGRETVGFRPPAGVRTPELAKALRDLGLPMVLWEHRFFDTVFHWTEERALKSLSEACPGSIVLLHDRKSPRKLPLFLRTLRAYINSAREAGFEFAPLTRAMCVSSEARARINL
ncbi:MAG: polysaccharide deacetylase family protein [Bdellovibrionia bacterium]